LFALDAGEGEPEAKEGEGEGADAVPGAQLGRGATDSFVLTLTSGKWVLSCTCCSASALNNGCKHLLALLRDSLKLISLEFARADIVLDTRPRKKRRGGVPLVDTGGSSGRGPVVRLPTPVPAPVGSHLDCPSCGASTDDEAPLAVLRRSRRFHAQHHPDAAEGIFEYTVQCIRCGQWLHSVCVSRYLNLIYQNTPCEVVEESGYCAYCDDCARARGLV
jgi:hypothetical protein